MFLYYQWGKKRKTNPSVLSQMGLKMTLFFFWFLVFFFTLAFNCITSLLFSFVFDRRVVSVIILQVGPSYLASWAQACLFIVIPLKASSSLLVCGSARASSFIPFYHLNTPLPHTHTHTHTVTTATHFILLPTSGTRKEKSDRIAVTWNLGCRGFEEEEEEEEEEDTMTGKSGSEP